MSIGREVDIDHQEHNIEAIHPCREDGVCTTMMSGRRAAVRTLGHREHAVGRPPGLKTTALTPFLTHVKTATQKEGSDLTREGNVKSDESTDNLWYSVNWVPVDLGQTGRW